MSTSSETNIAMRLLPWIILVVMASSSLYYIHQLQLANEQEIVQRQELEAQQRGLEAELSSSREQLTQMRRDCEQLQRDLTSMSSECQESNALLASAEQRIGEQDATIEQLRDERNVYKSSLKQLQKQTNPNAEKSTIDYEAQSNALYDPSIFGLPSPESGAP